MLRIKLLIFALFGVLAASAQLPSMLPLPIGSGASGANAWVLGDTVSASPATNFATVTATPARDFTGQTFIKVQTVDYPLTSNQPANLTDNKGNTYVNILSAFAPSQFMRIRYWYCYNPILTGGGVIITYSSTGGVANFPVIYAQGFSGVTTTPSPTVNSVTSSANISSIGTGSVSVTGGNYALFSTVATQNNISVVSSASGSMINSDLMNWRPFVNQRQQYSASYAKVVSGAGTYSVTHTTNGANFNTQSVAAIAIFK